MAEKTMGERVAQVEQWRDDHERRCDDRQTAMGREIRDMKAAVGSLTKGAWGIVIAFASWAAVTIFTDLKSAEAPHAAQTEIHVQR